MTKAFDRMMEGITDAAEWAAGNGSAVVYIDGAQRVMTKAEHDMYMAGRLAGIAVGREKAAKIVDEHARELMVYRDHHYVAKHLQSAAAAIRAKGE